MIKLLDSYNLQDCLPNSTVETENPYVDPFGLIPVSTIDETNLLLSSQQSNLVTYQETSTLVPKPLEMVYYLHFDIEQDI